MGKLLVLDNYDSFTYNLVHILREIGLNGRLDVIRNDKISLDTADNYDHILLSPGPGIPSEAGIMPQLIQKYSPSKSILGVCLGHQAIAEAFGAYLVNIPVVLHGVADTAHILDKAEPMFKSLPEFFKVGHYHSWAVKPKSVKAPLITTAEDENGHVMAIRHEQFDVRGLQFHPESIMTEHGVQILKNWLKIS